MENLVPQALLERKTGKIQLAEELLLQEIALRPYNTWAILEYADLLMSTSRADQAKLLIDKSYDLGKDLANIFVADARYYRSIGDLDTAISVYKECISNFPGNSNSYLSYVRMLHEIGNYEEIDLLAKNLSGTVSQVVFDTILFQILPFLNVGRLGGCEFEKSWPLPRKGNIIKNACIVMLVKNEEDIIRQNISHHYDVGFRYFVIVDNFSTDTTLKRVIELREELADVIIVTIFDPLAKYLQGEKTTNAAIYAYNYGKLLQMEIDWIFPIDADEFIFSESDLSALLADVSENCKILCMTLRNLSTDKLLFEVCEEDNVYEQFTKTKNENIYKNPVVKVAYRFDVNSVISMGNHYVNNLIEDIDQIGYMCEHNIFMNHLPVRSYKQIRSKIINGAKAVEGMSGGGHWTERYAHFANEGEPYFMRLVQNFINSN